MIGTPQKIPAHGFLRESGADFTLMLDAMHNTPGHLTRLAIGSAGQIQTLIIHSLMAVQHAGGTRIVLLTSHENLDMRPRPRRV